jgi:UDP-glucose 4-epimerase
MAYEFLSRMDVNYEVFNLGSGDGNSTLEVVKTFENENQLKLNYEIGPRRAGDVEKIFASNAKARKLLGWQPKRDLKAIVSSAWKWQKNSPDANQ